MPPRTKKRKLNGGTTEEYLSLLKRAEWPGWCELESEPAYFNVMLRELGVQGLKIHEVFTLDEGMLDRPQEPCHALIFLFRYQGNAAKQVEEACPQHVWFANQVPDHSCASVALLNIVNNIDNLDLGPHLQSFRNFTSDMSPLSRGYAIDAFEFLKRTHNSFARELDMLNANMILKIKRDKAEAKIKDDKRKQARESKALERLDQRATQTNASDPANRSTQPVRRSARQPKPRGNFNDESVATEEAEAEPGFHFIAYMPIQDRLWRLDGLDSFPVDLGPFKKDVGWLPLASSTIRSQMSEYLHGELAFSLMAVVHDPYPEAKMRLEAHEQQADTHESWQDRREADSTEQTARIEDANENEVNGVHSHPVATLPERTVVAEEQDRLQLIVLEEEEARARDARKAMLRRADFRPFFAEWLDALQDADLVEALQQQVKAGL